MRGIEMNLLERVLRGVGVEAAGDGASHLLGQTDSLL